MASIYRLGTKWRAQVRLKNKPSQSEVFNTKAEATAWARNMEGALHRSNGEDQFVTYAKIHEKYFENLNRVGTSKQNVCKHLLEYWGEHRLGEITTSAISTFASKRQLEGLKPPTVLKELIYMGVVLQHGGILANNQDALRARLSLAGAIKTLRNTGVVGDAKKRKRRPTEDELGKLRDYFLSRPRSQVPMWEIILFAIGTCMRLGEIVGTGGIVWEDVDDKLCTITIRGRKDPTDPDGFDQTIPLLTGHAVVLGQVVDPMAIILRQQSSYRKTGRIFPHSTNSISLPFTEACKKLGIEDLHFHDLRHDGISRMFVPGGYSIPEVAAVSGHRSWKHLQRYTNIRPEELHR